MEPEKATSPDSPALTIDNASIRRDGALVVRSVSLTLGAGEVACVVGPSGAGKTSLLRAIAGLEETETGSITFGPGKGSGSPAGIVFQEPSLFPHLNVEQNIGFGLPGKDPQHYSQRVTELLRLINLEHLRHRYPHEISGGQQQRVAIARALAPEPVVLLLDEPFANLDQNLRLGFAGEILKRLRSIGVATLFVSHHLDEGLLFADTLFMLSHGEILQSGSPRDLLEWPEKREVAEHFNRYAVVRASVTDPGVASSALGAVAVDSAAATGEEIWLLVGADDLVLADQGVGARVVYKAYSGADTIYSLALDSGDRVRVRSSGGEQIPVGEAVRVRLTAQRLRTCPG